MESTGSESTDGGRGASGRSLRSFLIGADGRLRSGWRIALHAVLWLAFSTIAGIGLALIGLLSGLAGGSDLSSLFGTFGVVLTGVAAVLATWVARRFLDRRSFRSLGLEFGRRAVADLAFGIVLTGVLFGLIYALEWGLGWIQFQAFAWQTTGAVTILIDLLAALGLYVLVGFEEELLFRGYQLQNLIEGAGVGWGLAISSVVFGLLHLGNPGALPTAALGIFFAGLFLGYAYLRTRQLWLPIGLHIGWNFFEGTVYGFPVSGLGGFHLLQQQVSGPIAFTGGAFGPEAGLVVLPALALGAVAIYAYTRSRTAPAGKPPAVGAP